MSQERVWFLVRHRKEIHRPQGLEHTIECRSTNGTGVGGVGGVDNRHIPCVDIVIDGQDFCQV